MQEWRHGIYAAYDRPTHQMSRIPRRTDCGREMSLDRHYFVVSFRARVPLCFRDHLSSREDRARDGLRQYQGGCTRKGVPREPVAHSGGHCSLFHLTFPRFSPAGFFASPSAFGCFSSARVARVIMTCSDHVADGRQAMQ